MKGSPDKKNPDESLEALQRRIAKLEALVEIGAELSSELNLDRLLDLIMDRTTRVLDAERSSLYLVDFKKQQMWTKIAQGTQQIRMPLGTGIAGQVAMTGKPANVADAYKDPHFNPEFDRKSGFRTRSVLAVPMRTRRGEIIGVTQALNKRGGTFTREDEELLTALSGQAAVAIEIARQYEERKRQFETFVRGLGIAIDARDHLTSGHTTRVTHYSVILAQEMGLPEQDVEMIRYAGWLHDLGKLGVPDRILCKPKGFTDDEFAIMKSHAAKTKLILKSMNLPRHFSRIPDMAAHHHERLNGQGYPDGLADGEIELGARIIAVADVFDALTSKRHYREPATDEEAVAVLEKGRGTEFDPDVLDALGRALPRLIAERERLLAEEKRAEAHGGLSGIVGLRKIIPEWERVTPNWSSVEKPDS